MTLIKGTKGKHRQEKREAHLAHTLIFSFNVGLYEASHYRYFKTATVGFMPKQRFYFSTTLFASYKKMQRQCNYGSGATNHYNPAKTLCLTPIHRSLVVARHLSLIYSISTTNLITRKMLNVCVRISMDVVMSFNIPLRSEKTIYVIAFTPKGD